MNIHTLPQSSVYSQNFNSINENMDPINIRRDRKPNFFACSYLNYLVLKKRKNRYNIANIETRVDTLLEKQENYKSLSAICEKK